MSERKRDPNQFVWGPNRRQRAPKPPGDVVGVDRAAYLLGLTKDRVGQYCRAGKIAGAFYDGVTARWWIPLPVKLCLVDRPTRPAPVRKRADVGKSVHSSALGDFW